MKKVHPISRLLALSVTYVALACIIMVYLLPLDRERRLAHAALLAQAPGVSDISDLVLPLVELQHVHDEHAARLRHHIAALSATPTPDEILGTMGTDLSARALTLARFAPLVTRATVGADALARQGKQLLSDRFEVEFRASLPQLIDLTAGWARLSLGLCVERIDITATPDPASLQVLMTCALTRCEDLVATGATP
ncbi:MAG: hypothetical protein AB7O52_09975 [Planctomycetota bacterium]